MLIKPDLICEQLNIAIVSRYWLSRVEATREHFYKYSAALLLFRLPYNSQRSGYLNVHEGDEDRKVQNTGIYINMSTGNES